MKVEEMYKSIQGEGLYSGCVTTFVRFSGCTLACPDCDTKYSWKSKNKISPYEEIAPEAVVDAVESVDPDPVHICITGGEPLEQPADEMNRFIRFLYRFDSLRTITVETGGHVLIEPFVKYRNSINSLNPVLSFCIDYKPPSTKKHDRMIWSNYLALDGRDSIKMVCADAEDFLHCIAVLRDLANQIRCPNVFFHSSGGGADRWLSCLVGETDWSWAARKYSIRFGVQLHKLVSMR